MTPIKTMKPETMNPDWMRRGGNGPVFRIARWFPWEDLRVQQLSLLALLDTLHQQRIDPAPFVAALAKEHRGTYRSRLNRLADRLQKGIPLVESLEQTPDALSDESVLALRLGSQSGTISDTFAMLLESQDRAMGLDARNVRPFKWYWFIVGMLMLFLFSFFGYYIAPTFRKLAQEMGWVPPQRALIFGNWLGWMLWIGLILLLLAVATVVLGWSSRVRRGFRQTLLPKLGFGSKQEALAPLLRMLSVSVRSGRPIIGSLSTLAKFHYNQQVRQRLLLARNEMEQGEDAWSSLLVSGVLQPNECRALQLCNDAPSQAWILQKLSEKHSLASRQIRAHRSMIIEPVLAIAFGLLVLWLAYSVFGTIYGLAESLT